VRRSVAGAVVTARFGGTEERVTTDRDGYFRIHLHPRDEPSTASMWHQVDLSLEQPHRVEARAEVIIPPPHCRFVVISDIDDTVMETGVANKLQMVWRLFVERADSRLAFPGVAALYQAFHEGRSGGEGNPILYVSRAPWGIYAILEEFFRLHRIPIGPVLFLREWGVSWKSPLPRKATTHKRDLILNMLTLYRDLPFVLIGDSGQHDPEVYREIVEEYPGRVLTVYIRNVTRNPRRTLEIEALAAAVAAAGSSLVLATTSVAMAEHAAGLGLVAPDAIAAVADERVLQSEEGGLEKTLHLRRGPADGPASTGELKQVLDGSREGPLPNVVVEATDGERKNPSER
jgi:phosphatidate phosphatase APP1